MDYCRGFLFTSPTKNWRFSRFYFETTMSSSFNYPHPFRWRGSVRKRLINNLLRRSIHQINSLHSWILKRCSRTKGMMLHKGTLWALWPRCRRYQDYCRRTEMDKATLEIPSLHPANACVFQLIIIGDPDRSTSMVNASWSTPNEDLMDSVQRSTCICIYRCPIIFEAKINTILWLWKWTLKNKDKSIN